MAREYTDVAFEEMMIDSISMKLVTAPQQFDVVVTTNQFGDILTDIGAGLVGGLGLAPGLCVGERQAIVVFVERKLPGAEIRDGQFIPAEFGGVATDVRVPQLTPSAATEGDEARRDLPSEVCLPDVQWIDWPKVHRVWLDDHRRVDAEGGEVG